MTTPRYDAVTNIKITKMTPMIGSNNTNAAIPAAGSSSIMICSGPYAVEEIASGEIAPSATGVDNLSDSSCSLVSGAPRKRRLSRSEREGEIPRLPTILISSILTGSLAFYKSF